MMVAEPLDRPPAPDAGDDFEVKIRVALQTPDDCRDALLLSREECIDEIPATLLRQMIEVTIVKAPRAAPSGIDPFGSVGHQDRTSVVEGQSRSVRVDIGGRRLSQKKNKK